MGILSNLPDAPLEEMEAIFINDITPLDCILNLNGKYAATTAGSKGAINIWKDIDENYRVEVQRYMITIDTLNTKDFQELTKFVKKWLKEIR